MTICRDRQDELSPAVNEAFRVVRAPSTVHFGRIGARNLKNDLTSVIEREAAIRRGLAQAGRQSRHVLQGRDDRVHSGVLGLADRVEEEHVAPDHLPALQSDGALRGHAP